MSDETKNMIDAATNTDGAAFKAAFDTAINQKVGDALQTQRQHIAQNVFGNIRVPTQEDTNAEMNEATQFNLESDGSLEQVFKSRKK